MGEAKGKAGTLAERLRGRTGADFHLDDPVFVEQVLKQRARRLAAARARDRKDEPLGQPVLCFTVAGESYAVPLDDLTEVMPLTTWTPVPGLPQHLLGVINVRGEIRPVLDLHAMLILPAPEPGHRFFVVFLRAGGGREIGLRVDALDRMRFIDPTGLTRPHEAGNGLPQRFLTGITPETLILLDVRQILALDVLQDRRADYRRAI